MVMGNIFVRILAKIMSISMTTKPVWNNAHFHLNSAPLIQEIFNFVSSNAPAINTLMMKMSASTLVKNQLIKL